MGRDLQQYCPVLTRLPMFIWLIDDGFYTPFKPFFQSLKSKHFVHVFIAYVFVCVCLHVHVCTRLQLFFILGFKTNSLTAPGNQWLVRWVGQWAPRICLSGSTSPHPCAQQWNCMYIFLWLVFKLFPGIWTQISMFTWQGIIPRIENFRCSIFHEVLTKKNERRKLEQRIMKYVVTLLLKNLGCRSLETS